MSSSTSADSSARRPLKWLLLTAAIALTTAGLSEAVLALMLRYPAAVRAGRISILRQYHLDYDRPIIQYLPQCSQYDPGLSYTLKPGQCGFSSREFETVVSVNSLGVRDDEASLQAPVVVVIGDSHAMGWGVQADSTFPSVLERMLGVRVLNAAVSSYGTVRELRMLRRVDMSALKVLVIQYSDNDFGENLAFRDGRDTLNVMSQEAYDDLVRTFARARRYWFPKHTYRVVRILLDRMFGRGVDSRLEGLAAARQEAEAFLHVLASARSELGVEEIVLLEVNGFGSNDSLFVDAVARLLRDDAVLPAGTARLGIADVSTVLRPSDYYQLDDHMRPSGHQKVAALLRDLIRDSGALAGR